MVGGAAMAGLFRDVVEGVADAGIHSEDDALCDDSTPRPPEAKSNAVPEEVAVRGLGPAGRVNLADSLWHKFVPSGLRAVYKRHARASREEHPQRRGPREAAVCRMFESLHKVTKGVKPTAGRVSATAFLRPKSAERRLVRIATSIIVCDDCPPLPPYPPSPLPPFLSVYFFSVSFCPCLPGPLGLDKLSPTPPPCPLTA